MKNLKNKKIAIICDWIKDFWGAEQVLTDLMSIFPKADIYTSVFFQKDNTIFKDRNIYTSFIQKIPIINKAHKLALFLRPLAFESFDLSSYDIVISSSSAESKWVITKPNTIHISYCHTPTRYFWSHYHEYLNMMEFWLLNIFWKIFSPSIINKLRQWDFIASNRVDYFIANSINTQNRIKKYYNRDSSVIYPWIELSEFDFKEEKKDFYLYVGRCIPYKKFDLVVDSFNENWKELIIVTSTKNALYKKLKSISKKNIKWQLNVKKEELRNLFSDAKCFLFPPEEDFWIVPLEAMASWTPVIAYKKWWSLETIIENETWIFFNKQEKNSLNAAINRFEKMTFDSKKIIEHTKKFQKSIFKRKILEFIEDKVKD